jgi:peptidoglycan/LPS O-acetylase OafA/YrhL
MTGLEAPPPKAIADRPTVSRPQGSASAHLDAMRGIAAFCVLLFHWRLAFFVDYSQAAHPSPLLDVAYRLAGLSHQAVMTFFVLSGYLVGGSVLRAVKNDQWSWRDYLITRLTRLYIVLIPALILCTAFDWTGVHVLGQSAIYGSHGNAGGIALDVHYSLRFPIFLGNLVFLQSLSLPVMGRFTFSTFGSDIPLWSLSYEFWYYIAFPIVVLALAGTRRWFVRLVYAASLPLWAWFVGPTVVIYSIPWLLGAAIHGLPAFPAKRPWARHLSIAVAFVLMAVGFVAVSSGAAWLKDTLLAQCVAVFVWVAASRSGGPAPAWYSRSAHAAASSSYTLYLVHLPFLIFLKAALHVPVFQPGWRSLLPTMGLLVAIVLYARLVYFFFEKRTDTVRRWLKKRIAGKSKTGPEPVTQKASLSG